MRMYLKEKFVQFNPRLYQTISNTYLRHNRLLDDGNTQQKRLSFNCRRFYSTGDSQSGVQARNFYDILEVDKYATHEEIKAAYYNLSKTYHPDINKDSQDAAVRFQEITDAYEVLGNNYLRRKYDKGVLHTVFRPKKHEGITDHHIEHEKFYQSRLAKGSGFSTQSTTHDYDSWSRTHYSQTIIDQTNAKMRRQIKKDQVKMDEASSTVGKTLLLIVALIIVVGIVLVPRDNPEKRKIAPAR